MLAGKRATRVGDQILKGVADLLMKKVRDPRVRGVTLTGISLSNDLKNARLYFSVMGNNYDVKMALSGLDSAKGFIKREIGHQFRLRYVPDIIFEHDPSMETGNRIERLIKQIKVEEENASE